VAGYDADRWRLYGHGGGNRQIPAHGVPVREAEIDTLARTIWAEARGEGLAGMKAVACVIANRVKNPGWWTRDKGDGIPDDTFQAACRDPWQFSCWNANDPNLPKLLAVTRDDKRFDEAWQIAELAVDGKLSDITHGATHYYATTLAKQPYWADGMEQKAVWGKHVFMA
jgi:N-acetylmuramoyl-L-alanine amidase